MYRRRRSEHSRPSHSSSTRLCTWESHGPHAGEDGHFLLALNIAGFEDVGRFKSRLDNIIREFHASARAPGVERVYVPGELEAENERRYRTDGIPLNDETLNDVLGACAGR